MRGAPSIPNRLLGVLRYGPSSSFGPDPAAKYLEMSPGELAGIGCYDFARDAEVIISAKSQFTSAQLSALQARAEECTGSKDPRLLADAFGAGGDEGVISDVTAEGVIRGALGAEGLLGGVADVIGNALLALAGLGLVVLGVTRLFGVSVGPLRASGGR